MCRMCAWNAFCKKVGPPMVMGFTHTVVSGVAYITCAELEEEMKKKFTGEEGVSPKLVILDARRTDEYFMSHIQNATNIHSTFLRNDKTKTELLSKLEGVDKDALIVTYCAVGLRSAWLAKYLMKLGYTNARVIYHGYYEWANEGRPISTLYPPNQKFTNEAEHEFQKNHPHDTGIHNCEHGCYATKRVLPQHWVAALVLDSVICSKLPFPKFLYGKHLVEVDGDGNVTHDTTNTTAEHTHPITGAPPVHNIESHEILTSTTTLPIMDTTANNTTTDSHAHYLSTSSDGVTKYITSYKNDHTTTTAQNLQGEGSA